ncbi:MAG: thioredoxin family protein [Bacteroidota bacterium]
MRTISIIILSLFLSTGIFAQEIEWLTFKEALIENQTNPKKIMVDVYTDWCGWCKVMDRETFSHPVIAEYINENYHAVKLNAEQKDSITIGDQTFKYVAQGNRGYHELAALLLNGKMSYPSVVFMDEKAQIIQPVQGYVKAKPFDAIIRFIGSNDYKTTSWEEYNENFSSSIE